MSANILVKFRENGIGTLIEGENARLQALKLSQQCQGIVVKYGLFIYGVLENVPGFLKFIRENPVSERNWFCLATEDKPKCGWLDIEFVVSSDGLYRFGEDSAEKETKPAKLVLYLREIYLKLFNEQFGEFLEFEVTAKDLCWSNDHRRCKENGFYKYSWHMVTNIKRHGKLYMDHFPIYHKSMNQDIILLPSMKGKRKGKHPISIPEVSNDEPTSSNSELSSIRLHSMKKMRILNYGSQHKFKLSSELNEQILQDKPNHFSIRSLPKLESFPNAVGILRSCFRRCPREYDIVRYAEENELVITQVKPWSKEYPDTFLYQFLPSLNNPCPNGLLHRFNGSVITWRYVSMERTVEMLNPDGLPVSDFIVGFGKLEHKCLDPKCVNGKVTKISKLYGDHYGLTLTPYWIPIDAIYSVITSSSCMSSVVTWLIRRLVSPESGIPKLVKTTKSWFIWNGIIWKNTKDPANKLSGFLDLYITSLKQDFVKGTKHWLMDNAKTESINNFNKLVKYVDLALEELSRQVRNVATVRSAIAPIATLIDGPMSEGWLAIGNRYINLETGIFHSPIPTLYISQIIHTPWQGKETIEADLDIPLPQLSNFLRELFSDRKQEEYPEFVRNIQLFLGYSLTGKANLHTAAFLYGSGRNGKGLFCQLLKATILADPNDHVTEYKTFDPAEAMKHKSNIRGFLEMETIEQRLCKTSASHQIRNSISQNISRLVTNLDKKILCKNARSATNAHTAQLMDLVGARCVIFDELNAREDLDLAKFKQYTGGDALVVRGAYNKDTFIIQKPMFTLIITTNILPGIPPEPSVASRIKVIQFNIFFDPMMREDEPETQYRKRDNFEREEIIKSTEMRGEFLRGIIRGAYLYYQEKRITWCQAIIKDTNEFWGQSDVFKTFLEEEFDIFEEKEHIAASNVQSLVEQGYYIRASEFENRLTTYYSENHTPSNQIIPLQRAYQRLTAEYNIFKLRTTKSGLKRAVYMFGLKYIGT